MKPHSDSARLRHMLDYAKEAMAMASGRTRADLDRDRTLNLALVRLLEVVGEAAARVSIETRRGSPQVPWAEIVNLRNRLIHGYDSVDFDILWDIVTEDLPPLVLKLEPMVESETSTTGDG